MRVVKQLSQKREATGVEENKEAKREEKLLASYFCSVWTKHAAEQRKGRKATLRLKKLRSAWEKLELLWFQTGLVSLFHGVRKLPCSLQQTMIIP